jgi:hypothetical protein
MLEVVLFSQTAQAISFSTVEMGDRLSPNASNNPPAKPGAFVREPLEAAMRGR